MRVVIKFWDEEQAKIQDIVVLGIEDEANAIVRGVVDGDRLTDEQLAYCTPFSSSFKVNEAFLQSATFLNDGGVLQRLSLSARSRVDAWDVIKFMVKRMKRMEIPNNCSWVRQKPTPRPEIKMHAILITSSDELDDAPL